MRRLAFLVLCAAGLIALAACGAEEEPAEELDLVLGSAQVEAADDDQAMAEAIVLRLDDFPTGWRVAENEEGDDDPAIQDCFERLDLSDVTVTARADGDNAAMGVSATGSIAVVLADEQQAITLHTRSSETINECTVEFLKSSGEVGEVDSGELSFPSFGEDSSAFQVQVSLDDKESDLAVNAFVDLVYVRAGRAVSVPLLRERPRQAPAHQQSNQPAQRPADVAQEQGP